MFNNTSDLNELINSFSFNEYVLIDCFKFNLDCRLFDFVALTEQGFFNVLYDILNINLDYYYTEQIVISFYNTQLTVHKKSLSFTIKYVPSSIKDLIDLPGLDFCKCCYDGIKMYCSPKDVQCYERSFKEVQYDKKLNLPLSSIKSLSLKETFWKESNKNYVTNENRKNEISFCLFMNNHFNHSKHIMF
jgi:hypothetical protein